MIRKVKDNSQSNKSHRFQNKNNKKLSKPKCNNNTGRDRNKYRLNEKENNNLNAR